MSKTKISEYSATANSNTDVGGINIDEGCAPSGINDAIRTLMAQLKNFQTGTGGDSFNGPIGTTTPAAGAFTTLSATGVATFSAGSASAPALTTSGDTNTGIAFPAADTVSVATGGTERVRVDSAGNVGVGVTPSAWGSNRPTIEFGGSTQGTLAFNGNNANGFAIWTNSYYGTGSSGLNSYYKNNGYASIYSSSNGGFQWFLGGTGSAGAVISSLTQAMTLDASGNLGIATTSPTSKLTIGTGTFSTAASGTSGLYTTVAEGLTVISEGVAFATRGGLDRMRLDTSGNLLVGTTSYTDGSMFYKASNTALNCWRGTTTATDGIFGAFSNIGGTQTVRAYFKADGGLANYSANNVNLSDERLKKDIAPAGNYLAKICAIPIKTFRYKDQEETENLTLGVIAQEVQQIAPELVSGDGFGLNEEGKQDYLSIYQTDLQYALMKCIQEQQALITQLQSDVAALKA